jgi:hypothetical protein
MDKALGMFSLSTLFPLQTRFTSSSTFTIHSVLRRCVASVRTTCLNNPRSQPANQLGSVSSDCQRIRAYRANRSSEEVKIVGPSISWFTFQCEPAQISAALGKHNLRGTILHFNSSLWDAILNFTESRASLKISLLIVAIYKMIFLPPTSSRFMM